MWCFDDIGFGTFLLALIASLFMILLALRKPLQLLHCGDNLNGTS